MATGPLRSQRTDLQGTAQRVHGRWPEGADPAAVIVLAGGFLLLIASLLWDWTTGARADGTLGHEMAIFAVSALLLYRRRHSLAALPSASHHAAAAVLLAVAAAMYLFGQAFEVRFALLSLPMFLGAVLLHYKGTAACRDAWLALLFPVFAVPLPTEWVLLLTGPLKVGVSAVAVELLAAIGYPAGRSGVVMTIGQYQLLVTEACAGLQTMFTLEAMGLLYAGLMNHQSVLRNLLLALLVVPIAFLANVLRVVVLALITFHFGDAAGQGFLHSFSGILLFGMALALVFAVDGLLGRVPSLAH